MRNLIYPVVFCLLIAGFFKTEILYSNANTVLIDDTINVKKDIIQNIETEVKINFEESKLAARNIRVVFNELFKQYILIKDALVYNNSYLAKRNTLKLLDDMKFETKDFDIMIKDDRWVLFIKNYDNIRKKIESAEFISDQRFLFSEITEGLKKFIKQYGLYDKTIYLMRCKNDTMKNNSVWFSESRDKKNPYLGLQNDTTSIVIKEVWKFP